MAHVDPDKIKKRLDEAFGSPDVVKMKRELGKEKIIVFSDQHKGARDGADDFQRCERSYNAALTYYNHLGYHLILLGDVEELWENEFEEVLKRYPVTLQLEADFREGERYTRVFGNHDLIWKKTKKFQDAMGGFGLGDITPAEAIRLTIVNGGQNGEDRDLCLIHGHQGTKDSDSNAWLSQFAVRRGWRWAQNLLNRPWNSPAVDLEVRGEHGAAMKDWARERGEVLIAGHTHLPVFWRGENKPEADPTKVTAPDDVSDSQVSEALRLARVAWAEAEHERLKHNKPIPLEKPWYFNTGCCSFGDGDITGIEIDGGEIRLVRWPADPETDRDVLGTALPLPEVFASVTGPE